MKVAVIGSGISGLSSAWLLSDQHEVVLFEAADHPGGHTNTVDVDLDGQIYPVDTGFLVYNDLTYPNLIQLFSHLGIATHETDMSFSVSMPEQNIEWAGTSLATVFGQARNLVRLHFWQMLLEIISFNSKAERLLAHTEQRRMTLGQLLDDQGYSKPFREWYLLPMAAAIWSSSPWQILDFPASTFLRFCLNHRLLQVEGRPRWNSVVGGGRTYVEKMVESLDLRLNCPVRAVERTADGVCIKTDDGAQDFDAVIFATHAPESLGMLKDADPLERSVLSAVRYQPNTAILHTDREFLPERESLWSAWNYRSIGQSGDGVCVTYLLNRLQKLPFATPVMVTLNPPDDTPPQQEIARFNYDHPIFDQAAIDAQSRLQGIQGRNRAWFCGAWTGYGFHEDGLKSALRILGDFNVKAPWTPVL